MASVAQFCALFAQKNLKLMDSMAPAAPEAMVSIARFDHYLRRKTEPHGPNCSTCSLFAKKCANAWIRLRHFIVICDEKRKFTGSVAQFAYDWHRKSDARGFDDAI